MKKEITMENTELMTFKEMVEQGKSAQKLIEFINGSEKSIDYINYLLDQHYIKNNKVKRLVYIVSNSNIKKDIMVKEFYNLNNFIEEKLPNQDKSLEDIFDILMLIKLDFKIKMENQDINLLYLNNRKPSKNELIGLKNNYYALSYLNKNEHIWNEFTEEEKIKFLCKTVSNFPYEDSQYHRKTIRSLFDSLKLSPFYLIKENNQIYNLIEKANEGNQEALLQSLISKHKKYFKKEKEILKKSYLIHKQKSDSHIFNRLTQFFNENIEIPFLFKEMKDPILSDVFNSQKKKMLNIEALIKNREFVYGDIKLIDYYLNNHKDNFEIGEKLVNWLINSDKKNYGEKMEQTCLEYKGKLEYELLSKHIDSKNNANVIKKRI